MQLRVRHPQRAREPRGEERLLLARLAAAPRVRADPAAVAWTAPVVIDSLASPAAAASCSASFVRVTNDNLFNNDQARQTAYTIAG